jgi:hypothetical protein
LQGVTRPQETFLQATVHAALALVATKSTFLARINPFVTPKVNGLELT